MSKIQPGASGASATQRPASEQYSPCAQFFAVAKGPLHGTKGAEVGEALLLWSTGVGGPVGGARGTQYAPLHAQPCGQYVFCEHHATGALVGRGLISCGISPAARFRQNATMAGLAPAPVPVAELPPAALLEWVFTRGRLPQLAEPPAPVTHPAVQRYGLQWTEIDPIAGTLLEAATRRCLRIVRHAAACELFDGYRHTQAYDALMRFLVTCLHSIARRRAPALFVFMLMGLHGTAPVQPNSGDGTMTRFVLMALRPDFPHVSDEDKLAMRKPGRGALYAFHGSTRGLGGSVAERFAARDGDHALASRVAAFLLVGPDDDPRMYASGPATMWQLESLSWTALQFRPVREAFLVAWQSSEAEWPPDPPRYATAREELRATTLVAAYATMLIFTP
jgi:hypothetical protein